MVTETELNYDEERTKNSKKINNPKKVYYLFYIPMITACFIPVVVGSYALSELNDEVLGYSSIVAGVCLTIAYLRLFFIDLYNSKKSVSNQPYQEKMQKYL